MKINYKGLIRNELPSGSVRWLVRVKGKPNKRITLPYGPTNTNFKEAYNAARAGETLAKTTDPLENTVRGTVAWLAASYMAALKCEVEAGQKSPLTLAQREPYAGELCEHISTSANSRGRKFGDLPASIPQDQLQQFMDKFSATPGKAVNMRKFLRAMYVWAIPRGHCRTNPAAGIEVKYKNQGGATPWTMEDLNAYKKAHPPGTMAHLTLSLFMFTACRVGDAYRLGRADEFKNGGEVWLGWQPAKKGSSRVELPVLPPLLKAIRSQKVVGPTYILNARHMPFTSPDGLRNNLKRWCKEAGIGHLSSHGIRKAAGHLLSLHGATQYEIMAVHGHASASTSEVYTKGVERQRLASSAAAKLSGMDW